MSSVDRSRLHTPPAQQLRAPGPRLNRAPAPPCPSPAARTRLTCTLGPPPPMRMPRNTGGIVITSTDRDPHQALTGFTGAWKPNLSPATLPTGTVVLQLLPPADGDDPDLVDVWLWLTRHGRWLMLSCWKNAGPGWTYRAAPLIHAALPAPPASAAPQAGAAPQNTASSPRLRALPSRRT